MLLSFSTRSLGPADFLLALFPFSPLLFRFPRFFRSARFFCLSGLVLAVCSFLSLLILLPYPIFLGRKLQDLRGAFFGEHLGVFREYLVEHVREGLRVSLRFESFVRLVLDVPIDVESVAAKQFLLLRSGRLLPSPEERHGDPPRPCLGHRPRLRSPHVRTGDSPRQWTNGIPERPSGSDQQGSGRGFGQLPVPCSCACPSRNLVGH